MIIIETERLVLRQLRISDADAMHSVFGDPEVMCFGDGVQTREWIDNWLSLRMESYRLNTDMGPWAVECKDKKTTIGYCGIFDYPDVCGQPEKEIGYRLARQFWGHGYATEGAKAVRDSAFTTLCLPRVISIIDPQNLRSINVAKKLGMSYEKDVMFDGYTHPDHVYVLERETWSMD